MLSNICDKQNKKFWYGWIRWRFVLFHERYLGRFSFHSSNVCIIHVYVLFQERFWARLRTLPCIPLRSELLPVCKCRDPEIEVLTLLSDLHMLPLQFADDCWLPFLRKVPYMQKFKLVKGFTFLRLSDKLAILILTTRISHHFDINKKYSEITFVCTYKN